MKLNYFSSIIIMKTALMLIYDLFSLSLIAEWNQFAWVPKERNVKIGENEKKKKKMKLIHFLFAQT